MTSVWIVRNEQRCQVAKDHKGSDVGEGSPCPLSAGSEEEMLIFSLIILCFHAICVLF